MNKAVWVVNGIPYTRKSAGVRALHTLAKKLDDRGERVMMTCTPHHELKPIVFEPHDDPPVILIQPEIAGGDCREAAVTVRWLLNSPGKANVDKTETWGKDDLLFHFEDRFKIGGSQPLFVPHVDEEIFNNKENPSDKARTDHCFYSYKSRKDSGVLIQEGWIDVSPMFGVVGVGNWETMASIFRRTQVFHTMEETATAIEAALCGAEIEYLTNPYLPVAPDIPDHALYYRNLTQTSDRDVDNLVNLCYKRVGIPTVV